MATLSIVEFNHNCIKELWAKGHISFELYAALQDDRLWKDYEMELDGVRKLAQRHHSETIDLKLTG